MREPNVFPALNGIDSGRDEKAFQTISGVRKVIGSTSV